MECGRPASLKTVESGECPGCGGADFDAPSDREETELAARWKELRAER